MLGTEHRPSGHRGRRRKPEEAQRPPSCALPLAAARPEGLAPGRPQGPPLLLRPFSRAEDALRSQPESALPPPRPVAGGPSQEARPAQPSLAPAIGPTLALHHALSVAPVWSQGGPHSPVHAAGVVTLVSESCWCLGACPSFGSSRAGLRLCSGRGGRPGKCNSVMPRTTQRSPQWQEPPRKGCLQSLGLGGMGSNTCHDN